MELILQTLVLGALPTFFSAAIMGLIVSRRGFKFSSGFGYGALVGFLAALPWGLTGGLVLAGMVGAVLGVTGLIILLRRKFPKVIKPYEKRT